MKNKNTDKAFFFKAKVGGMSCEQIIETANGRTGDRFQFNVTPCAMEMIKGTAFKASLLRTAIEFAIMPLRIAGFSEPFKVGDRLQLQRLEVLLFRPCLSDDIAARFYYTHVQPDGEQVHLLMNPIDSPGGVGTFRLCREGNMLSIRGDDVRPRTHWTPDDLMMMRFG